MIAFLQNNCSEA